MSEDERQRQMDFIINALAQLTAKVDTMADIQRADAVRIGRVEEAFVTMTDLATRFDERLDEHGRRIVDVEQAIVTLTRIVEQRDGEQGSE